MLYRLRGAAVTGRNSDRLEFHVCCTSPLAKRPAARRPLCSVSRRKLDCELDGSVKAAELILRMDQAAARSLHSSNVGDIPGRSAVPLC